MNSIRLAGTLQIIDSMFPVGAFAYSDGLESAVARGDVQNPDGLAGWMHHYLSSVFITCDGRAALQCSRAAAKGDWTELGRIDSELTALKSAAPVRTGSRSIGRRVIETYGAVSGDSSFIQSCRTLPHCNAAVAYSLVLSHRGLDERELLVAFGYARLAGMISAGMRLIALGQQEGQLLLTRLLDELPEAIEKTLEMHSEPLRSFSPVVDVCQMSHRYLYSRLFRS